MSQLEHLQTDKQIYALSITINWKELEDLDLLQFYDVSLCYKINLV